MKIKLGKWKIDISTIVRIEWHKPFPKLILHERYEKFIKWILHILTLIGIATSIITLSPVCSLLLSIALLLIEQFFERTVFEYSIFYVFNFPNFEIDYSQWVTSGYFLLNERNKNLLTKGYHNYFGPTYRDKQYAIQFFNYIKGWNDNQDVDFQNRICVSIIIENNEQYSCYIYPNVHKKEVDEYFSRCKKDMALEKYGKNQQEMIMQTLFWKKNIRKGSFFYQFIDDLKISNEFYFAPSYLNANRQPVFIEELKVLKNEIKIKKRNELTNKDIEFHFK